MMKLLMLVVEDFCEEAFVEVCNLSVAITRLR